MGESRRIFKLKKFFPTHLGNSNVHPGMKTTELDQENEGKVQEDFKIRWYFSDGWQQAAEGTGPD